ncbi:hypothetical protein ABIB51_004203 [Arthrobacter sp. UYCu712]
MKRVGLHQGLDPGQDPHPCLMDTGKQARQLRQDDSGGTRPGDHDVLLIQGGHDLG